MNRIALDNLLNDFKEDKISLSAVTDRLKTLPFEDLEHTKLDHHRQLRNGYPEVIYGEGKTYEQLCDIINRLLESEVDVLATRIEPSVGTQLLQQFPQATYHQLARCFTFQHVPLANTHDAPILIVTAGTSDLPVAEEAKVTAQLLGHQVNIISDVGVAGIHRLFSQLATIRQAKVVIVVAGMEGALVSVMGGLIDTPIIAVPTSIGYGANFGGITALLGMLSSCANGITVTNIDNGYGAAYAACKILNVPK